MVSILKRLGQFFLETIEVIVMALSVFIIVYLFLFQPHQVKGSSMMSSFEDGEFLLTDKISYRFNEPTRGDVIVFKAPATEPCSEIECEYIKRIVGIPGDRVAISRGKVILNGEMLVENYLDPAVTTLPGTALPEGKEIIIPEGYYLPLGDNRSHSRDGREFGAISRQSILGKAMFRYWPVERIGIVKHPTF